MSWEARFSIVSGWGIEWGKYGSPPWAGFSPNQFGKIKSLGYQGKRGPDSEAIDIALDTVLAADRAKGLQRYGTRGSPARGDLCRRIAHALNVLCVKGPA